MTILYASTFTDALGRLTSQEQKQVKVTTVDLMLDPRGNGLQLHRIEAAPGFWTARVSQDIRIVLHKESDRTLLAWVGHHNDAYRWAERRRLIPHERTGAMQFVPVVDNETDFGFERSTCENFIPIPEGTDVLPVDPLPNRPFEGLSDDILLDVGVPRDWLAPVKQALHTEVDELFSNLPGEAAVSPVSTNGTDLRL